MEWPAPDEEKGDSLMSSCTRAARVGWLGLGCFLVAVQTALAGPVRINFSPAEASTTYFESAQQSQLSPLPIGTVDVLNTQNAPTGPAAKLVWLDILIQGHARPPLVTGQTAVDARTQALSVPLAPIPTASLVAMTGGLIWLGRQVLNSRR
jgi:hypothetical protein